MKILLTTDGSPTSERAIAALPRLTPAAGREVVILHVRVPAPELAANVSAHVPFTPPPPPDPDFSDGYLESAAASLGANGIPAVTVRRDGVAWREILAVAEEYDVALIVVGCHHLGGIARMFHGSVSEALATHTRRPLLIIP